MSANRNQCAALVFDSKLNAPSTDLHIAFATCSSEAPFLPSFFDVQHHVVIHSTNTPDNSTVQRIIVSAIGSLNSSTNYVYIVASSDLALSAKKNSNCACVIPPPPGSSFRRPRKRSSRKTPPSPPRTAAAVRTQSYVPRQLCLDIGQKILGGPIVTRAVPHTTEQIARRLLHLLDRLRATEAAPKWLRFVHAFAPKIRRNAVLLPENRSSQSCMSEHRYVG